MNIKLTQDEVVSLRAALKRRLEQCDQQLSSAYFRGEKAVIQGILAKIDSDIDAADYAREQADY